MVPARLISNSFLTVYTMALIGVPKIIATCPPIDAAEDTPLPTVYAPLTTVLPTVYTPLTTVLPTVYAPLTTVSAAL